MFTSLFIAFLIADIVVRGWMSLRQIRYVKQHRDQVPAEFSGRIGLSSHQRAADYTHAKIQISLLESCVEAVVLVALTLLGGLQMLDVQAGHWISNDIVRQLVLIGMVLLIVSLVGLPFTLWRKFRLEARFGFNRVTPALFWADTVKAVLLLLVLGVPLAALVLWVMGSTGPAWVWWAWLIWVAFNFLVLWLFPTVIAPLFNKFTPLDNPEVTERILALTRRCGFPLHGLFVMDGSKRSAHGNAYFTGFGKARRIVFFDTLLARLNTDEIEAVLAHELGHFKYKHVFKRMAVSFVLALVFFIVLGWLSQKVWFYTELGVVPQLGRPNDALALILFFLAMPIFTFWVTPLAAWLSRRDEFAADNYAARQCSPDALISALVKLYDDNAATLTPDPLHSAYYDSHPPATIRIQNLKKHAS
ncbi:MAG: M48 family peptidase [Burkholderiaceae bacterium]|nr:MAG: M48 family peptidase [Burkholderiaceae bacterium]TAM07521.1 MAG: M48 family peptidase [Pusillimonas sp.]